MSTDRDPFALAGEHPLDPVAEAAARWRASMDPALQAIAEWQRLCDSDPDGFSPKAYNFWRDVVAKVKPTTLQGAIALLRVINNGDAHPDELDNAISFLAEMGAA
ncbi:MAG TPA: hypothetical protein VFE41_03715, partial [Acetobacteraceae bacterium]|nr:hypothetical protein [Acetobacteraceae bacterium]